MIAPASQLRRLYQLTSRVIYRIQKHQQAYFFTLLLQLSGHFKGQHASKAETSEKIRPIGLRLFDNGTTPGGQFLQRNADLTLLMPEAQLIVQVNFDPANIMGRQVFGQALRCRQEMETEKRRSGPLLSP